MTGPPSTITCVECGADAHLISFLPVDEPLEPGAPLAYRCSECTERYDLVWDED